MVARVERGMKVMLKDKEFIVGEKYNGRKFETKHNEAKGKVLVVRDKASNIFDTHQHVGVIHFDWVDELKDVNLDNLISAVIKVS
jgi:hypothetical protein